jgi:hypothetical protein
MHLGGPGPLMILNEGGVTIGKNWKGNGNLTVEGTADIKGNTEINGSATIKGNIIVGKEDGDKTWNFINFNGKNKFSILNANNENFLYIVPWDTDNKGQNWGAGIKLYSSGNVEIMGDLIVSGSITSKNEGLFVKKDIVSQIGKLIVTK